MTNGHRFNGIGDKFAARKRIFHTVMPHGNTVAYADGRKSQGRTSSHTYASLDRFGNAAQVHMARDNVVLCVDYADDGAGQFLIS